MSEWCDILSGVLQGLVLGPLLFVLYVNDIDDSVSSKILKFADDTKIYNKVNSVDGIERLQADLSNLISSLKEWQILFNIQKCALSNTAVDNWNSLFAHCINCSTRLLTLSKNTSVELKSGAV